MMRRGIKAVDAALPEAQHDRGCNDEAAQPLMPSLLAAVDYAVTAAAEASAK